MILPRSSTQTENNFSSGTRAVGLQLYDKAMYGHCPNNNKNVIFGVFTAVTVKNAVVLDVAPCRSCVDRRSSETWVHTRSIRRHIPEDENILQQ
jgi:hypothetical protein